MLRILAMLFGTLFILSGAMGFIPEFVTEGKLFGIFAVNTIRNLVHLGIGFLGVLAGIKNKSASKAYFIVIGLLFLVMAAMGFYYTTGELFNYIVANGADNWLHGALALLFLYIGFTYFKK